MTPLTIMLTDSQYARLRTIAKETRKDPEQVAEKMVEEGLEDRAIL